MTESSGYDYDSTAVNSTALPTTESESSFCDFSSSDNQNYLFGGIGFGFAIILSFTARRVWLWPHILGGRPGLVLPGNLLEGNSNRHVYCLAFASMTVTIIQLVLNSSLGTESNPWTKTLVAILHVFLYSGGFSIIVMCIEPPHRLTGYSLGFLYSLFAACYRLPYHFLCDKIGIGTAPDVLLAVPEFCIVYVTLWFAYKLAKEIQWLTSSSSQSTTFHNDPPYQMEYVRKSLTKSQRVENGEKGSWVIRFVKRHTYQWDPCFKYSTRMLVTVAVSAVAIWELTVAIAAITYLLNSKLHTLSDQWEDPTSGSNPTSASNPCYTWEKDLIAQRINGTCSYVNGTIYIYLTNGKLFLNTTTNNSNPSTSGDGSDSNQDSRLDLLIDFIKLTADATPICMGLAISCSSLIILVHLPHLLSCYRKHMKRLYRGETFFLPRAKMGTVGLMTSSWKYSGFQIAYMLWGWIILSITFFTTFFVTAVCLHYKFVSFKNIFLKILPTLVFTVILIILQFLLAKFVLLTDRGAILGLENRRLFHLFGYFFFFYNTLVGLCSCLRRIITALVLGTVMIDRLDRSTYPRGWESLDKGYKSYVGFLLMEHEFSNPYLVTFIYLLQQATKGQQPDSKQVELQRSHVNSAHFVSYRSRLVRNRWLVTYTLINNPTLLADRSVDKLEHAGLISRSLSKSTTGGSDVVGMDEVLLKADYLKPPS